MPHMIVEVGRTGRYRAYALGAVRGEVSRYNARIWIWRVWRVIGPVTCAKGRTLGVRRATSECLAALVAEVGDDTEA